eukprot:scaffold30593_cov118-Isochrysis_galbana.AAC.5
MAGWRGRLAAAWLGKDMGWRGGGGVDQRRAWERRGLLYSSSGLGRIAYFCRCLPVCVVGARGGW